MFWSVAGWESLRDIAYEAIAYTGNNYDGKVGASNFIMGGSVRAKLG